MDVQQAYMSKSTGFVVDHENSAISNQETVSTSTSHYLKHNIRKFVYMHLTTKLLSYFEFHVEQRY